MIRKRRFVFWLLMGLIAASAGGCTLLQKSVQQPTVSITSGQLTALNFQEAQLLFDLQIENPNRIGATLEQLEYTLYLNNHRFLSGKQTERLAIEAQKSAHIALPVTVGFQEAARVVGSLSGQKSLKYQLKTHAQVDVPIIGTQSLNNHLEGSLPLPRLPSVSIERISLSNLTFSGASIELVLALNNPGGIDLGLEQLEYALHLGGEPIMQFEMLEPKTLPAGDSRQVSTTLHLDLRTMGLGLYRQLSSGDVQFRVAGANLIRPLHPLMESLKLPFEVEKEGP